MTTRTVMVNVTANVAPAVAGLNATAASANKLAAAQAHLAGAQAKTATSMAATGTAARGMAAPMATAGQSMRGAAVGAGLLSPALLGGGGVVMALKSAVGASVQFEHEFANVRKTVSGSDDQLARIAGSIRQMSTEMPATTTELNAVAAAAGQLGVATEDLESFTREMAMMGVATDMAAEEAAFAFARLANITQTPLSNINELTNVTVALGNQFAAQEGEITNFALRIAGAGQTVGMTTDQIFALSTALPAMGLNAEAGGSAVSRIMVEMAGAVESGAEELDEFARVSGMTSSQFQAAWRDDAAGAFLIFLEGLQRAGAAGESTFAIIDELGLANIRTQDTLLRGASAAGEYARALEVASGEMESLTALEDEYNTFAETTASQWQQLGNNITEMLRQSGDEVNSFVDGPLEALNEGLSKSNAAATTFANAGIPRWKIALELLMDPLAALRKGNIDLSDSYDDIRQQVMLQERDAARWQGAADAYTGSLNRQADAAGGTARAHEDALEALEAYIDGQRAATDPVFALESALGDVEQAQRDYDAAVKEHGANSQEAADANWTHLRSIADLEAAALDGSLSFDRFSDKLDEWVDGGRITAEQADRTRARVADLRGEAEDAAGDYDLHIILNNWREASEQLDGVERRAIAASQDRTLTVDANTSGALRDLRALEAVARRTGAHIAGITGRGGFIRPTDQEIPA